MFLFFQPVPPSIMDMGDFLHDINSCAVPLEELKCGEYCFHHCVNPFQHPCLDKKIHHLTALLRALSNTCGGIIQLSVSQRTVLGELGLSSFISRVLSLPDTREYLLEISQSATDNTSSAIIAAKTCQKPLFCNVDNKCMKLSIDINGQLLQEECSQRHETHGTSQILDETLDVVPRRITDVDDSPFPKLAEVSTGATDKELERQYICQLTFLDSMN